MTPAARLQAALDLLETIALSPRPADGVASEFFRSRRFIGSKDRREIADRVWIMLRNWARAGWQVRHAALSTWPAGDVPEWADVTPRQRLLADLVQREKVTLEELESLFNGEKFGPARLRERERSLIRALKSNRVAKADLPDWVAGEMPGWIIPRLRTVYQDRLPDVLDALTVEAPVDLRVNTLKADLETVVDRLAGEEVDVGPGTWSPLALRLIGRANLPATAAFRDGLVEVQDEGSQLLALLTDAHPGQSVVDFCAGAGGKTLAIAATMQNKGRLVACDVSAGRLERSAVRLKRAGVHNVTRHLLEGERDKWVKRSAGKYDRVLIDAPCSGTGTWRRNPDAKWRLRDQDVRELVVKQASILSSAARLAAVGGRVIYATCSLLPEENERQVDAFLAANSGFRLLPVAEVWAQVFGPDRPCPVDGPMLRLDPAAHGTDGFFAAILERVGDAAAVEAVAED